MIVQRLLLTIEASPRPEAALHLFLDDRTMNFAAPAVKAD